MTSDLFEQRVREICTEIVTEWAETENRTQSHIDSFCDWVMINYNEEDIEEMDEDDYYDFLEDAYEDLDDDEEDDDFDRDWPSVHDIDSDTEW